LNRRVWRFVFFGLAILAGFTAGLGYGWVINPVRYKSTSPETLRRDYQTDFILMTAELYNTEGDLPLALARLDFLGDGSPLALLNAAIDFAHTHHYAPTDLQLMQVLAADIVLVLGETE